MGSAAKWMVGLVLAGLAVSACGADNETVGPSIEDSTRAGAQSANVTPAPAPTSAPTAAVTPTSTVSPASQAAAAGRPLSSVLDGEPGPAGWRLPAGRWTTTAFAEPVTFTTQVDLTVLSETPGAVYLANPAEEGSINVLVLAAAAFLPTGAPGSPEVPVPQGPQEITAFLESSPVADLVDTGPVAGPDRDVRWWEVVLRETPAAGSFPCPFGDRCLTIVSTTGGDLVNALVDERLRVFDADVGDLALGAYVIGQPGGYDSLVTIAEDLVASLEITPPPPESEQRFLGSLGIRQTSVPPGNYRVHLGTSVVDFAITEEIETLSLEARGPALSMFGNPSGLVTLLGVRDHIDPDADQTAFSTALTTADYLPQPPQTVEEFDAWLRGVLAVTDTGEAELGRSEAVWWDITVDSASDSVACRFPPSIGGQCVAIMATAPFVWQVPDNFDSRIYFFEDTGTVLYVEAFPGSTVEDLLDDAASLLDSMTFVPIG